MTNKANKNAPEELMASAEETYIINYQSTNNKLKIIASILGKQSF